MGRFLTVRPRVATLHADHVVEFLFVIEPLYRVVKEITIHIQAIPGPPQTLSTISGLSVTSTTVLLSHSGVNSAGISSTVSPTPQSSANRSRGLGQGSVRTGSKPHCRAKCKCQVDLLLRQEGQQRAEKSLGVLHLRDVPYAGQYDLPGVDDVVVQQFLTVAEAVNFSIKNHR